MKNLLERDVANMSSPLECALERARTDQKTSGCGDETRLFARRSVGRRDSGLPLECIVRKRRERNVLVRVSHINPASCSVTASGANRRPAAGSLFCFRYAALRVTASIEILFGKSTEKICDGPSAKAELM